MGKLPRPDVELAGKILPPPLLEAIRHVFRQGVSGCMLVGGTALAGYYAGHRRSDDMDLCTRDPDSQKAAALAVESLAPAGYSVTVVQRTPQYFKTVCRSGERPFTIDVSLHQHLFSIAKSIGLEDGVQVADIETLLRLKAAALVSRCSEKDLYDLLWLLPRFEDMDLPKLVALARSLDAGASPEGLLISVLGARLDEESCAFATDPAKDKKAVYREILLLRDWLKNGLQRLAGAQPVPPLGELVRKVRRFTGS